VPRYVPRGEAPVVTIAPPTPPSEYDPGVDLVEKNARRSEFQRRLDRETGDVYYQQRTGDGADAYTAVHSFFRDLLTISRSRARELERRIRSSGPSRREAGAGATWATRPRRPGPSPGRTT
jgi:hypothetical protein